MLAGVQLGLRARDFDGRRGSILHQLLVVVQELLRCAHFPLARAYVGVEADQIPVEVQRGGNGGDELELELQRTHLHVILLHANVPAVHRPSESLQQVLGQN